MDPEIYPDATVRYLLSPKVRSRNRWNTLTIGGYLCKKALQKPYKKVLCIEIRSTPKL